MQIPFKSLALAAAAATMLSFGASMAHAQGKVFKWANDGDVNSMDPYARNETFLLSFTSNVYEALLRRDKNLKLEPSLATAWKMKNPTLWEFTLREGVKFHDGTPFVADDVVFSLNRANGPGSNIRSNLASVKEIRKTDAKTIEIETKYPDPLLADKLALIGIMSKAWAEKHNAVDTADMTKNEENYATRNANGTGPFMLKSREPDVKTVLAANPNWWDKPEHNISEAEFYRIANAGTRTSALLSGEVQFVYTVPPADQDRLSKDPNIKVLAGPETRIVFLGFDQERNELLESNIKGKNPFKDVRVRQAFFQAIDVEAIKRTIMRGQSFPTAMMVAPGINGYMKELDVRPKFDPEAAKKLLAEAGYPEGFEVGMDCPNDRYVNDEAICKAVVAMLAKVGVKVNLNAQTRLKYFAKILRKGDYSPGETSFYMLGWSPAATYDVHNVLEALIQTPSAQTKKGQFNAGGYSNKKVDELADKIEQETDKAKRDEMIKEALKIHLDEVGHIPLHQQAIVWAMRKNIEVVQPADNYFPLRFVKIN